MKQLFGPRGWKGFLLDLFFSAVGGVLVALSCAVFTVPNDIAPGGVSGLGTALAAITPVSVGTWALLLLIAGWRILGARALVMTLDSALVMSAGIDWLPSVLPTYTGNSLLAAIAGGILMGAGIGLLFLRGISTGGTDLLALLLKKPFPNLPSGTLLMVIDGCVVAFAVLVFRQIEVALTSAVCIYCSSKVIDAMAQGVDYAKVIYVVTSRGDAMLRALNAFDRGSTLVRAQGGYTGAEKQLIITVTHRNVLAQTLRLIRQTDSAAFTFVTDSTEVHGEGFQEDTD